MNESNKTKLLIIVTQTRPISPQTFGLFDLLKNRITAWWSLSHENIQRWEDFYWMDSCKYQWYRLYSSQHHLIKNYNCDIFRVILQVWDKYFQMKVEVVIKISIGLWQATHWLLSPPLEGHTEWHYALEKLSIFLSCLHTEIPLGIFHGIWNANILKPYQFYYGSQSIQDFLGFPS